MIRITWLLLACMGLTACSGLVESTKSASRSLEASIINTMSASGDDENFVPKPLEELTNTVSLQVRWQTKVTEGLGNSLLKLEMALSEGRLFVASQDGLVVALEQSSGEKLWLVDTKLPIAGGIEVGSDNLFFGTSDAEVVALKLADGETSWTTMVSSEVLSMPRYDDGFVVVRSIDGAINALEATDGKEIWSYIRDVPALSLRGISSPVLKSGGVISGYANGKLVVLRLRDGLQIWETSVAVPRGRDALSRMVDVDADPLAGERFIYAATYSGGVAALDVKSGQIAWRRSEMSSFKKMAEDWVSIFVVDVNNVIWSADKTDGSINWQQDKLENRRLTPLVKLGEYLVTADFEGYLHVLSTSDGHLVGRYKVSDVAITNTPVVDGDLIYIQDVNGEITSLQLTDDVSTGGEG